MYTNLIRLSVQRALLGHITPNLRAVYINYINDLIQLIFYYNNPPTEEEEELSSLTDTEFIADFPAPDYQTDCQIFTISHPTPLPKEGVCVYHRFE